MICSSKCCDAATATHFDHNLHTGRTTADPSRGGVGLIPADFSLDSVRWQLETAALPVTLPPVGALGGGGNVT